MKNESPLPTALDVQALGYIEDLFGGCVEGGDPVDVQRMHRLESVDGLLELWRVSVGAPAWLNWTLHIARSRLEPGQAVLLSPDGCWPGVVNGPAIGAAREAGVALAWFNRVELAHDAPDARRSGPVFDHWPTGRFGALSVWAWGLHRCVDALLQAGLAEAGRIGVVGHSRGGKAALLAGGTDARIGAVISHNSGTGGAASLKHIGGGSESLAGLAQQFPHWLGQQAQSPEVQQRITATDSLPLLRGLAPRGLCLLQASDDLWANPAGTQVNADQLRPLWAMHRVPQNLQWHARTGGHAMTPADWARASQFVTQVCSGA
jgi:hypothetical protein